MASRGVRPDRASRRPGSVSRRSAGYPPPPRDPLRSNPPSRVPGTRSSFSHASRASGLRPGAAFPPAPARSDGSPAPGG